MAIQAGDLRVNRKAGKKRTSERRDRKHQGRKTHFFAHGFILANISLFSKALCGQEKSAPKGGVWCLMLIDIPLLELCEAFVFYLCWAVAKPLPPRTIRFGVEDDIAIFVDYLEMPVLIGEAVQGFNCVFGRRKLMRIDVACEHRGFL